MLEFSVADIGQFVGQWLWPLFRISGFLMAAPILGAQVVPARVRMALAIVLTVLVVPVLEPLPAFDGLSIESFIVIANQVLIGVLMGFSLQLLSQVFILAGQMIAMNMAMGFTSMVDPANGINVVAISQYYLVLVTLMFIASNGHLVMIEVLVESFHVFPIGTVPYPSDNIWRLLNIGSWMFASAVLIAIPVVTALLIVNFAFGVMARAAPQLNVFSLGFPFSLLLGLLCLYIGTSRIVPQYDRLAAQIFVYLRTLFAQ